MSEEFIPIDTSIIEPTPIRSESAIPARKCEIEKVLHPAVIELCRISPMNAQLRSMIYAKLGHMPPSEMDTFDKIRDWIETTCDAPVVKAPVASSRRRANAAFSIDIDFSEDVRGTCCYSGTETGSGTMEITEGDIHEALDGAVSFDDVLDAITTLINEDAQDRVEPEMNCRDGYDYDDHINNNSEGLEQDYSASDLRTQLRRYLQDTLTQEQLDDLGV